MNNTSMTIANAPVVRAPKTFGEGKNQVTVFTVAANPIGEKAKERYNPIYVEVRAGGIFAARAAELQVSDRVTVTGPLTEYEYDGKNGKVKQLSMPFPTIVVTPFKAREATSPDPEAGTPVTDDPFEF